MTVLLLAAAVFIFLFGGVVFLGAPYLPTLRPQITTALDLLDLKPGQIMLEIGSGDGRVLRAAAERGWHGVGYELNPLLVLISLWRLRKYRKQVRIVWGNAWTKQWPEAMGIYVFGLDKLMPKVDKKIVQSQRHAVKLVSFGFTMPGKKPVKTVQGVYLYQYGKNS